MLSGPQSAETAVKELNGCRMQGRVLHLEHISRPTNNSQNSASEPDSSQDAAKPQTSKTDSSSTEVSRRALGILKQSNFKCAFRSLLEAEHTVPIKSSACNKKSWEWDTTFLFFLFFFESMQFIENNT